MRVLQLASAGLVSSNGNVDYCRLVCGPNPPYEDGFGESPSAPGLWWTLNPDGDPYGR